MGFMIEYPGLVLGIIMGCGLVGYYFHSKYIFSKMKDEQTRREQVRHATMARS